MGADTSKIEGQRNDAMRERDEAIANSKREKQAKDEKIKQLAEKLTETTKTIEVLQASAITEKDKQISDLGNDKVFHEKTIKFLLKQNEQQRIDNRLFVDKMMDRFEKMALMIANIPHQPQNTGPTSSAFDGSFMQGSFFDDNFENYMSSSGDQTETTTTGLRLPPIKDLLAKANRVDLLNYFTEKMREYGTREDFDVAELMKFTEEEIQKLDDEMKKPCGSGHEGEVHDGRIRNLLKSIVMGCRSGFKCAVCHETELETVLSADEVMLCYCPYGPQITHCLNKCCAGSQELWKKDEE